jgi:CRISPR system Cascade subunit CasC
MNDKNYINYHVLISHSPSNLNRDDMNMQKTATFGGTRRVRVSSQCLKRAMRTSKYYQEQFKESSDRSKQLTLVRDKYRELLQEQFSVEIIDAVLMSIAGVKKIEDLQEEVKKAKGNEVEKIKYKGTETGAVVAWSMAEVKKYCQLYQELQEQHPEAKDFEKAWNNAVDKKKLIDNKTQLSLFREALQNSKDIALSGRMATSGIMTNVDAALAVAHAITTHTVDGDIDWFTAVDDLNQETGETGSAHLDTTEFSAGVFYRYASLNIRQLQENLGDVSRQQALEIAAHVLHMLATIVPTAKQNTFAAFNLADFAFVSFSDQPISLANAFESPIKVKGHGYLMPSIEGFVEYHKTIYQAFGLHDDPQACFSTKGCSMEKVKCLGNDFIKLKAWITNNGE